MSDDTRGMDLRPRTVGVILTDAFDVYRRSFLVLVSIVAAVVVPLTLLQYYLVREVVALDGIVSEQGELVVDSRELWRILVGGLVLGAIGFVVTQLAAGAATHAVVSTMVGTVPSVGSSYGAAFSRLGALLVVALLTGLAVVGGFLLLIVPGFIVLVRLIVGVPAVVVEAKRGTEALSRSWALTRGHGWRIFGAMLVVLIVVGIFNGILTGPLGDDWVAQGIAAAVASVLTTPYVTAVIALLYVDIRVRTEELDHPTLRHDLAEGR